MEGYEQGNKSAACSNDRVEPLHCSFCTNWYRIPIPPFSCSEKMHMQCGRFCNAREHYRVFSLNYCNESQATAVYIVALFLK
jgi:hypothetical protein